MISFTKYLRNSCINCHLHRSFNRSYITNRIGHLNGSHNTKTDVFGLRSNYVTIRPNFALFRNFKSGTWKFYSTKAAQSAASSGSKGKQFDKRAIERLLSFAKPERWKIFGAVSVLVVSSAVSMFVPFAVGKLIDMIGNQLKSTSEAEREQNQRELNKFCGTLIVIFIIGGACNAARVYLMSVAGQRISKALREKVYKAMIRQETAFFDQRKTGELLSRLSSDTLILSDLLSTKVSDGLRSIISTSAGLSMMFFTSTKLSFIALAGVVPPIAFLLVVVGRYLRKISKEVQGSLAAANQVAEERFSNIRVVKTFGHEKYESSLYTQKLADLIELARKEAKVRAMFFGLTGLSGNIILVSSLYIGAPMLIDSTLTVGQLSSFLLYAGSVSLSASGIANLYAEVQKGLGVSGPLFEVLDKKPHIAYEGGLIPEGKPQGQLDFSNVSFAYPTRSDVTVLNGLNLTIPAGAMTAVVGGSGSGKSTIASLLLRFYDPLSGHISFDGRNVSELDWSWLRKNVALVSQEPVLFSGSIRDNIAYGSIEDENFCNVPEDDIWKAAEIANADKFIKALPNGLDTVVGERGITLSGGQRQRVAIARALMRDPKVLLLDEATSALDAESEHLVQESLEKIMHGRTVLVIAHRLSTVRNADQIAVLENGSVAELGSYDELMSREGAFKTLVRLQTFDSS
ncbi:ABC-transporter, subfamily B member 02 [Frankliniella occidentalis]|uniref:ATP-binding cassette sub-family B member 10, mitochondrial n=1 Tax=Frankliniella occidentalis TaxID=133901 RepID=A0A6J1S4S7_FRAOC|nr:ATP-binding cassette sub-family B member 10, mitochondrial [Frankliniella occidentalis]XP_026276017.1 ATP-binding cassette sub-family B member 10, mitochondrial [Frankliniella occidentalis]KAE8748625.1 ABC-transporter, subfamily B member 02 [Frankliniella occidentalis]